MKLDLLTNTTVVSDAMRFVSQHIINNSNNNDKPIDNNNSNDMKIDYSADATTTELLHNAAASSDVVTATNANTTNKVF